MTERTALYRYFDASGDLLYVGITNSVGRRWDQQAQQQPWWPSSSRQTVDWYPTRGAAETAERAAVQTEKPLYNSLLKVQLTPRREPADCFPECFAGLRELAEQPETIEQAKALTDALNAVPELQKWLRERRQHVVRTLHERDGMSYTDMAPHLGVKPERVSGIARGHSRAPKRGKDAD